MSTTKQDYLSPPALARKWRVNCAKIYELIAGGQLVAVNLAVDPAGKPRLRIKLVEIKRFEQSRSTKPSEKSPCPAPKKREEKVYGA